MRLSPQLPKLDRPRDPNTLIGIISVADAKALIRLGYLTLEEARRLLPIDCWPLLESNQA